MSEPRDVDKVFGEVDSFEIISYEGKELKTPMKKKVGVVLIYDEFDEKTYKKDFQRFVDYQTKANFDGTVGESDWELYRKVKNFEYIEYSYFRKTLLDLLSRSIFQLLKENPLLIPSNSITFQIKLKSISHYFEMLHKLCDEEDVMLDMSGVWAIQMIVAPMRYLGKINYSTISRYFLHELSLFYDNVKKYEGWVSRYEKKTGLLSRKRSAYNLNFLYHSLFNLREDGLGDFIARMNSSKIDLNMTGIKEYNQNMISLTELPLKRDSEPFYEGKISFENLTPSGEHVIGRNMCLFVAMKHAKKDKKPFNIHIGNEKVCSYDHKELNEILSKNHVIYISSLNKSVIEKAITEIRTAPHYYFIRVYENACDEFNISDDNRIMTQKRFFKLKQRAIECAKIRKSELHKKYGFCYIDFDDYGKDKEAEEL